ncbi:MAG TPA: hypothetical protein VKQ06_04000 [Gammaproteobacteria bacterium]|nr:hypothetical protein [Gammaproteobacteria bacterium]
MCFRFVVAFASLLFFGKSPISQEEHDIDLESLLPGQGHASVGAEEILDPNARVMTNEDLLEMTRAEFSDATIIAVIDANETAFDVRPAALVKLKTEGVSESVIEQMLASEAARRNPSVTADQANDAATGEDADESLPADSIVMLSQAIEKLAAVPAAPERDAAAPPVPPAAPVTPTTEPRAWYLHEGERTPLPASVAEVAFADSKPAGGNGLRTLEALSSSKALLFASPALAIANEIGGLFRSDDPTMTAVWALPGTTAPQLLHAGATLELDFSTIPGVNPDDYRPGVVQLVPTPDNFRLVGAARTKVSDLESGTPSDPVIEESVPASIERTERGRFLVTLDETIGTGEYALVLRPLERKSRRRNAPASLGELLGAGASQLLYVTWDFSIAASG